MRRRLTFAIVGVVAAALVVAGMGTLLLVRRSVRDETRAELVRQATTIAQNTEEAKRRPVVDVLRRTLQLEGFALVRYGPLGRRMDPLPAGLREENLALERLQAGETVSGTADGLVYAATPVRRSDRMLLVVVLTRAAPGVGAASGYLLLAAGFALLVAVVVADRLSRRIALPLREAQDATRRIAAGDLAVRVSPHHPYPELDSLARSINAMAESLARAKGLERQFLLSVSHDLRTPLTSIRGFAEAIADGTATDARRAAEVVTAEARRLERLVQDLLDLAKLDSSRFSLDFRRVDVVEVVVDTTEGFRPAAEEACVRLDVDVPDGPLDVQADPDRLAQAVANLIENALKFANASVTVTLDRDGTLTVADDGPGIPAEDLAHVFERLYQSRRTPARAMGSGLGLAIVAELVTAMGGTVRAESPPDDGARLVVRLRPLSRSPGDHRPVSSST